MRISITNLDFSKLFRVFPSVARFWRMIMHNRLMNGADARVEGHGITNTLNLSSESSMPKPGGNALHRCDTVHSSRLDLNIVLHPLPPSCKNLKMQSGLHV